MCFFSLLLKKQIFEAFRLGNAVSLAKRCLAVVANMFAKSVGKSRLLVGKSRLFNCAGFLLENGKRGYCPEAQKGAAITKRQLLLKWKKHRT